ncbi:copper chaperone PCu(A)C [Cucumibacter marinus]|uniref:copper chaperone PCu(A)C n=1 Tax=Cucumibacter marinus TaxID=1121252 RepID=UPI00048E1685|nr:copper chaperone PCu(A)C [Cucumibacter marinus]
MTTTKTLFAAAIAGLFLAFSPLAGFAHNGTIHHGDIDISGQWTRATPPGAKAGGAYITITNNGDTADRLIGGTTEAAEALEVHSMSMQDGVMKMEELPEGLTIEPGETVTLEPGGLHLMMIGLDAPLVADEKITVTLTFEKAGEVTLDIPVGPLGSTEAPMMHEGHDGH